MATSAAGWVFARAVRNNEDPLHLLLALTQDAELVAFCGSLNPAQIAREIPDLQI